MNPVTSKERAATKLGERFNNTEYIWGTTISMLWVSPCVLSEGDCIEVKTFITPLTDSTPPKVSK